ncbi:hypothetical protein Hypma_015475 [Hypsizygus marmoreus]|uniref:Uncharacterized protein n=1 Tax=Hypsizygus marmoreus TaxID=39966 RepID=A0A369K9H6_HYPMA|nr:hypothetical protein Hypma_015475 [Hypsizygus marmoreus]
MNTARTTMSPDVSKSAFLSSSGMETKKTVGFELSSSSSASFSASLTSAADPSTSGSRQRLHATTPLSLAFSSVASPTRSSLVKSTTRFSTLPIPIYPTSHLSSKSPESLPSASRVRPGRSTSSALSLLPTSLSSAEQASSVRRHASVSSAWAYSLRASQSSRPNANRSSLSLLVTKASSDRRSTPFLTRSVTPTTSPPSGATTITSVQSMIVPTSTEVRSRRVSASWANPSHSRGQITISSSIAPVVTKSSSVGRSTPVSTRSITPTMSFSAEGITITSVQPPTVQTSAEVQSTEVSTGWADGWLSSEQTTNSSSLSPALTTSSSEQRSTGSPTRTVSLSSGGISTTSMYPPIVQTSSNVQSTHVSTVSTEQSSCTSPVLTKSSERGNTPISTGLVTSISPVSSEGNATAIMPPPIGKTSSEGRCTLSLEPATTNPSSSMPTTRPSSGQRSTPVFTALVTCVPPPLSSEEITTISTSSPITPMSSDARCAPVSIGSADASLSRNPFTHETPTSLLPTTPSTGERTMLDSTGFVIQTTLRSSEGIATSVQPPILQPSSAVGSSRVSIVSTDALHASQSPELITNVSSVSRLVTRSSSFTPTTPSTARPSVSFVLTVSDVRSTPVSTGLTDASLPPKPVTSKPSVSLIVTKSSSDRRSTSVSTLPVVPPTSLSSKGIALPSVQPPIVQTSSEGRSTRVSTSAVDVTRSSSDRQGAIMSTGTTSLSLKTSPVRSSVRPSFAPTFSGRRSALVSTATSTLSGRRSTAVSAGLATPITYVSSRGSTSTSIQPLTVQTPSEACVSTGGADTLHTSQHPGPTTISSSVSTQVTKSSSDRRSTSVSTGLIIPATKLPSEGITTKSVQPPIVQTPSEGGSMPVSSGSANASLSSITNNPSILLPATKTSSGRRSTQVSTRTTTPATPISSGGITIVPVRSPASPMPSAVRITAVPPGSGFAATAPTSHSPPAIAVGSAVSPSVITTAPNPQTEPVSTRFLAKSKPLSSTTDVASLSGAKPLHIPSLPPEFMTSSPSVSGNVIKTSSDHPIKPALPKLGNTPTSFAPATRPATRLSVTHTTVSSSSLGPPVSTQLAVAPPVSSLSASVVITSRPVSLSVIKASPDKSSTPISSSLYAITPAPLSSTAVFAAPTFSPTKHTSDQGSRRIVSTGFTPPRAPTVKVTSQFVSPPQGHTLHHPQNTLVSTTLSTTSPTSLSLSVAASAITAPSMKGPVGQHSSDRLSMSISTEFESPPPMSLSSSRIEKSPYIAPLMAQTSSTLRPAPHLAITATTSTSRPSPQMTSSQTVSQFGTKAWSDIQSTSVSTGTDMVLPSSRSSHRSSMIFSSSGVLIPPPLIVTPSMTRTTLHPSMAFTRTTNIFHSAKPTSPVAITENFGDPGPLKTATFPNVSSKPTAVLAGSTPTATSPTSPPSPASTASMPIVSLSPASSSTGAVLSISPSLPDAPSSTLPELPEIPLLSGTAIFSPSLISNIPSPFMLLTESQPTSSTLFLPFPSRTVSQRLPVSMGVFSTSFTTSYWSSSLPGGGMTTFSTVIESGVLSTNSPGGRNGFGRNTGAIIGIALASSIALLMVVFIVFYACRRYKTGQALNGSSSDVLNFPSWHPPLAGDDDNQENSDRPGGLICPSSQPSGSSEQCNEMASATMAGLSDSVHVAPYESNLESSISLPLHHSPSGQQPFTGLTQVALVSTEHPTSNDDSHHTSLDSYPEISVSTLPTRVYADGSHSCSFSSLDTGSSSHGHLESSASSMHGLVVQANQRTDDGSLVMTEERQWPGNMGGFAGRQVRLGRTTVPAVGSSSESPCSYRSPSEVCSAPRSCWDHVPTPTAVQQNRLWPLCTLPPSPSPSPSMINSPQMLEGLLIPHLRMRLASSEHSSSASLRDHIDYSRPITERARNRLQSTATFQTEDSLAITDRHTEDSAG